MLSTTSTGTSYANATYTSIDKYCSLQLQILRVLMHLHFYNNVHYSHWYYLLRFHILIYWQYCPPQPLILHVLMPLTLLLTILSTTATGTTFAKATWGSTSGFLLLQYSNGVVCPHLCFIIAVAGLGGAIERASDWRPGGHWFDPRPGRQHSFVEIDHEIFSMVILSLPLIQEGQLSVSG